MFDLDAFLILEDGFRPDKKKYSYYSYYGKKHTTQHKFFNGYANCIIFPHRFRIS